MKRALAIVCAALWLCGTATAGKPAKLTGTYKIKTGKMPDKKKYGGKVDLTAVEGGSPGQHNVVWTTGAADNPTIATGIGMVFGKRFAAAFTSSEAPSGVGVYDWCEINGAVGSLCGTFYGAEQLSSHGTMDANGKTFAGTYSNAGDAGPDAITEFTITKVKKTIYALTWTMESGEVLQGVGIEADKRLFVAWGDASSGLALYKVKGKKLDGQWVQIGSNAFGTEKLAKGK